MIIDAAARLRNADRVQGVCLQLLFPSTIARRGFRIISMATSFLALGGCSRFQIFPLGGRMA